MINLFLITNQPDVAAFAVAHGVTHLFVDLEVNGKQERQGHLDTLISKHSIADVSLMRHAIEVANQQHGVKSELLVRINPWFEGSVREIEEVIEGGADWIMLPMYRTVDEVEKFCGCVAGRAKCMLLLETVAAYDCLAAVTQLPHVDMIHIGLNDLHLEMQRDFMFELLADGTVERMARIIKTAGIPFGFGGIARVGEGLVSAEQILGEHIRLGSSAVILSRTFHRRSQCLDELKNNLDFGLEIEKLRKVEAIMSTWTSEELIENQRMLVQSVAQVVALLRNKREAAV